MPEPQLDPGINKTQDDRKIFSENELPYAYCGGYLGAVSHMEWVADARVLQHWIANNLLGLAFAVNGVELLHLNNIQTGALLLVGLFVYDIFWVFGTNVMVTVAKSFEAPIKCE